MAVAGLASEYQGRVFRHCAPDHANLDKTLAANRVLGGRFNPPGEFGAIYASLDRETVGHELGRRAERLGIKLEDLAPRLLLILEVKLERVLDLNVTATRRQRGITLDALRSPNLLSCQKLARAAREEGYEAIRSPSATGTGENLTIFLANRDP